MTYVLDGWYISGHHMRRAIEHLIAADLMISTGQEVFSDALLAAIDWNEASPVNAHVVEVGIAQK